MPIPLICCVDPGHDDAFALIMAACLPQVDLLAVSTVGGNQTLNKVTQNALNVLNVMKKFDIPVVKGSEHALLSRNVECPEIHGESGLDTKNKDFVWPPLQARCIEGIHSAQYIAELLLARKDDDDKVHIVATGRLTNVALLLSMYPQAIKHIAQITIMGGSYRGGGNTGRSAEFNIQCDPEAAQIVFNHGCSDVELELLQTEQKIPRDTTLHKVPIVLIPLDITHTVIIEDHVLQRLSKVCPGDQEGTMSTFGQMCHDLLLFFSDTYKTLFHFESGPPLHDPVALFYALCIQHNVSNDTQLPFHPSQIAQNSTEKHQPIFETVHTRVDVDTSPNPMTRGSTCVDLYCLEGKPKNIILGRKVNVEAFFNYLFHAIEIADKNSIFRSPPQ